MVFHKHYLKSYVAEFVFSEIDKMLASSYFFIEDYKTQQNKKKKNQLLCHISFDLISEIKGSLCYVTIKLCEFSP